MEMRTLSTNQLKTPGLLSVLLIAGSSLECGVLEESTGLISKMAEQHSVLCLCRDSCGKLKIYKKFHRISMNF